MQVLAHGEINVHWQGLMLVIDGRGIFNIEGVEQMIGMVKQAVADAPHPRWTQLHRLDSETMTSQQGFELLWSFSRWSKAHGCIGMALSSPNLPILEHNLREVAEEANVRVFLEPDAAQRWLEKQLSSADER